MDEKKCAWCGKKFTVYFAEEYGWKVNGKYFCRYTCIRAYDKATREKRDARFAKMRQQAPKEKAKSAGRRITPEQKEKCVALYTGELKTALVIAKEMGISYSSVYKALREAGVYDVTRDANKSNVDIEKAIAMRKEGMSYERIAKAMGAHETTVRKQLKAKGVE